MSTSKIGDMIGTESSRPVVQAEVTGELAAACGSVERRLGGLVKRSTRQMLFLTTSRESH